MKIAVTGSSGLKPNFLRAFGEEPEIEVVDLDAEGDLQGAPVVVGCHDGDPAASAESAKAALEAGASYVSTSVDLETFQALSEFDAVPEGKVVVKSMSLSPGVTNLIAKLAVAELQEVSSIRVCWAASAPNRSLLAQTHRSGGEAVVFRSGNWAMEPAGSDEERIYFPPPLGWRTVRLFAGAEVLSVPHTVPGLDNMQAKADFGSGIQKATVGIRSRISGGIGWSAARVDVTGRAGGDIQTITYGLVDETYNSLTAPAITAAVLVANGRNLKNGSAAPEEAFEPGEFLAAVAERGIRLARLTDLEPDRAA